MKLYIGAPLGEIPESAHKLAKQIMLPIKQSEKYSSVTPVFEPEERRIDYSRESCCGFIHIVHVVDEFLVLRNCTQMVVYFENNVFSFKPAVEERHIVIFKNRFMFPGIYRFDIVHEENEIIFSGEINVNNC